MSIPGTTEDDPVTIGAVFAWLSTPGVADGTCMYRTHWCAPFTRMLVEDLCDAVAFAFIG